ncbi:hypothetical protein DLR71_04390 [Vibrio paracholerae]|nr:hypothetical protein B7947_11055 [Vibrio paracholerae]RBM64779.1 hypothetical protein DLR71_04390 [Vibrio paracholerae]
MGPGEFRRIIFSPIPFLLEAAAVLATFARPNYIVYLCSWGFTHLPPACNCRSFRHITSGSDTHLKTKKGADAPLVLSKKLVLIDTQHIEVAIDQLIHRFLFT